MPSWVLPWPNVTVNSLYLHSGRGTRLRPRAVEWREEVIVAVRQPIVPLPPGPLALLLRLVPPRGRKIDGDNLIKLTQDSIMAGYCEDDNRIKAWLVYQDEPGDEPRIEATLQALGDVWNLLPLAIVAGGAVRMCAPEHQGRGGNGASAQLHD